MEDEILSYTIFAVLRALSASEVPWEQKQQLHPLNKTFSQAFSPGSLLKNGGEGESLILRKEPGNIREKISLISLLLRREPGDKASSSPALVVHNATESLGRSLGTRLRETAKREGGGRS